ncbi:MAG TPA: asparagine synthase (glutamine-hydrolyzing) [Candidatus Kapabacteria bacterium]|nr:asparagine synthase (glutamine-hydrolyzing) [Candidatus Kapabacteria bacterium]
MCGIAGILSLDGSPLDDRTLASLEKMTSLLAHRGPDDSGVHVSPSRLCAFGHRRLSIIDLSPHAHQPYQCASSSLVFNGEILNFEELSKKYYGERESSDTVVLAKLLRDKGLSILSELRGFFAFASWDEEKKELLIARDAIGKKPLYYSVANGRLIFASELRPIVASGIVPFKINTEALDLYLTYYSVPTPHSIVENVKTLQPGHSITVKSGELSLNEWWRLPKHHRIEASRQTIVEDLRDRFFTSVNARLISDAPLGLFHSGGLDSNAVLAAASSVSTSKLSTFNVRFGKRDNDESSVARASASHFGAAHTELAIGEADVAKNLQAFFYRMDSPTGDGLNTFLVSQAVCELRPDIKVVLSGVGGDELFVGYKKVRMLAKMRGILGQGQRKVNTTSSWTTSRLQNMLHTIMHPLEMRDLFTSAERVGLIGERSAYEHSITDRSRSVDNLIIQQLLRLDLENYLPHTLLRDLDVMTMAHQQEARAPFLDRELVEYAWQIPLKEKLQGRPKQLIVEMLGGALPDVVLQKKKTGFELPVSDWLRFGFMRPMLDDLLNGDLQLVSDGILQARAVRQLATDFTAGNLHYMKPWSIIALEHWYRSYTSGMSFEEWTA